MPLTRPHRLSESLRLCALAVETFPGASAHYHLALALSRAGPSRDIPLAIEHARSAVEQDSQEIRHWHLLGLLLVGTDDWKKAKAVLEYGAEVSEAGDEGLPQTPNGDAPGTPNGKAEGLPPTDVPFIPISESSSTLLSQDATTIPSAASLLKPHDGPRSTLSDGKWFRNNDVIHRVPSTPVGQCRTSSMSVRH